MEIGNIKHAIKPVHMFDTPTLGFVIPFAGTTPPAKWMFCQGQELPISEHETLFSLIGTTFGGDGWETFALPNLCGRVAVNAGQNAVLPESYTPGETGGREKVSITVGNIPIHNHELKGTITATLPPCANKPGDNSDPSSHYPAVFGSEEHYSDAPDDTIKMGKTVVSTSTPIAGNSEPVYLMSPFLAMNYIICIDGLWPSRANH
jgi:microcystin-dependent protein